jgi:hypothetical protein
MSAVFAIPYVYLCVYVCIVGTAGVREAASNNTLNEATNKDWIRPHSSSEPNKYLPLDQMTCIAADPEVNTANEKWCRMLLHQNPSPSSKQFSVSNHFHSYVIPKLFSRTE